MVEENLVLVIGVRLLLDVFDELVPLLPNLLEDPPKQRNAHVLVHLLVDRAKVRFSMGILPTVFMFAAVDSFLLLLVLSKV